MNLLVFLFIFSVLLCPDPGGFRRRADIFPKDLNGGRAIPQVKQL